jgi:hypothetical protein
LIEAQEAHGDDPMKSGKSGCGTLGRTNETIG